MSNPQFFGLFTSDEQLLAKTPVWKRDVFYFIHDPDNLAQLSSEIVWMPMTRFQSPLPCERISGEIRVEVERATEATVITQPMKACGHVDLLDWKHHLATPALEVS